MRGNYLFAMMLLACAACAGPAGTSTGNPIPLPDAGPDAGEETNNDGLAAGGFCNAGEMTPIELDEATSLGFSANDILAFAAGAHETAIRWNPQMSVSYGPETGEGEITIAITPKGTARFVEPKEPMQGDGEIGLALIDIGGCSAWVEIDVDVSVTTAGGALDESFEAVLRTSTALSASLYTAIEPDELGGDFEVTVSDTLEEGWMLKQVYLNVSLSTFGVSGIFNGFLERHTEGAVGVGGTGSEPYADFGFAKCDNGGFAVGLDDEVEGATAQAALDLFAAHDEVDITWQTGDTTTGALAFTADTEGSCVLLDNEMVGDVMLVINGTLSLTSEDERLAGTWPGRLEAHVADDGSFERVQFMLADGIQSNVMIGAAYYGLPNEDITGYDAVGVSVDLAVSGGALNSALNGNVTLTGYTFADCGMAMEPPPPDDPEDGTAGGGSSPGCAGAEPTIIATASID